MTTAKKIAQILVYKSFEVDFDEESQNYVVRFSFGSYVERFPGATVEEALDAALGRADHILRGRVQDAQKQYQEFLEVGE